MTATDGARDASLVEILRGGESAARVPGWLQWVDDEATRWGDSINPILVKETRQALKSRQFVVTFSLLLLAAFAWSVIGSLLQMPQIYYSPSAPRLLVGYYFVLAVPMLLVVPLAAYRSLEGEVDDGTLELLTVTSLSPVQIVTGKLGSAALQMMLYFIVLFPCVAYAYTLRGIDLPTLGLLVGILMLAGIGLTMVALFLAPVSPGRTGQIAALLAVMAILLSAEIGIGTLAINLIRNGNPLSASQTAFIVVATLTISVSLMGILLVATAAKLTPASENRSTKVRVASLVHMFAVVAVSAFSVMAYPNQTNGMFGISAAILLLGYVILFWMIVGAMMAAESPSLTPRIRRELPGTFVGRLFFTWLTPGPATGFVFAITTLVATATAANWLYAESSSQASLSGQQAETIRTATGLVIAYLSIGFVGVRGIISFLRQRNPVDARVGIAALAVTLLLMAVVPYGLGLHLNDYRQYEYSIWQSPNWAWTLELAIRGRLESEVVYLVAAAGAIAFFGHLMLLGQRVLPQRLATPERVEAEYRRMAGLTLIAEPETDPLGLGNREPTT